MAYKKFDILKATASVWRKLIKGAECIGLLLSQASKDIYDPFFRSSYLYLAYKSLLKNSVS